MFQRNRRRPWHGVLALLPVAAVMLAASPAAWAGQFTSEDFDGDGVANLADNCLLIANPDQRRAVQPAGATPTPRPAAPSRFRTDAQLGEACSGYNDNYRRNYDVLLDTPADQLETIYKFLEAGPMPGWDVKSQGWFRCGDNFAVVGELGDPTHVGDCGTGLPREAADIVVPIAWGGKWFYTNADGGHLLNRWAPPASESDLAKAILGERRTAVVRADVSYGTSPVDGGNTIMILYDPPVSRTEIAGVPVVDGIVDECRAIQTGVYHCYTWTDLGPQGPLYLNGFFFLDTKRPRN
jgi:hypothetical protein